MNNRRKLLVALCASALAAPLESVAQRQRAKTFRLGFLSPASATGTASRVEALRAGLRDLGYVEGKNIVIEFRWADGKTERLPTLAAELVQLKVDVIVTAGATATGAAQKATATIPIVMGATSDPVGGGFVKSLARPGANITGLSVITVDISAKHLEMLLSMVPKLSSVAALLNPTNAGHSTVLKSLEAAARVAKVKILPAEARSPQEIERMFSMMAQGNAGAVIVAADAFFNQQSRQIAELAAKHRLPTMSVSREYVEAGGLISYGPNVPDSYRRAALYVDKILKGAKPGDLPVEQPTTFELFISRKTAKALGLTIPQSLVISADKVIE